MHTALRSILIVTKSGHREAEALGERMRAWLAARGLSARVVENTGDAVSLAVAGQECSLALVLGGDGTILGVARRLLGSGVPLLGVNLGKVGFLAEVAASRWEASLERLLAGGVTVQERLALSFRVEREGVTVHSGGAVNDVVINRGILARVINLDLRVGSERLGELRADGLIVSTPTGATGYSVSARGPLVHPQLHVYTVTPICPFLNNLLPLVLPGEARLSVTVRDRTNEVYLTQDGQEGYALRAGDVVHVERAPGGMLFATIEELSYYRKLKAKGFIKDQS